jgi:hypothetical protein
LPHKKSKCKWYSGWYLRRCAKKMKRLCSLSGVGNQMCICCHLVRATTCAHFSKELVEETSYGGQRNHKETALASSSSGMTCRCKWVLCGMFGVGGFVVGHGEQKRIWFWEMSNTCLPTQPAQSLGFGGGLDTQEFYTSSSTSIQRPKEPRAFL